MVHPINSTIHAGTGNGVFKSGDGGKTWQSAGLNELLVGFLVFDPANPSTIYALAGSVNQLDVRSIL